MGIGREYDSKEEHVAGGGGTGGDVIITIVIYIGSIDAKAPR